MAPGWTSYYNRTQYQVLDISDLPVGENELSVTVGNGWYRGYLGFDAKPDNYGNRTALLAMLVLKWEDGEEQIIGTDTDWQVQKRKSDILRFIMENTRTIQRSMKSLARQFFLIILLLEKYAHRAVNLFVLRKFLITPKKIVTPKKRTGI